MANFIRADAIFAFSFHLRNKFLRESYKNMVFRSGVALKFGFEFITRYLQGKGGLCFWRPKLQFFDMIDRIAT